VGGQRENARETRAKQPSPVQAQPEQQDEERRVQSEPSQYQSEHELEARAAQASVTVERPRLSTAESSLLGLSRCLSPALPANIYIAVSLGTQARTPGSEIHARCYPDLLDIGLSSFATLPRRGLGRLELGSPYDNMGPRVTATGSSTFSLVEQPEPLQQPVALVPLIQPPPEFVSL
jgi:hypothetical protein